MERHDRDPAHPYRFGFVDVYSHDNGLTWGAESGHYDLTYDDALRRLIDSLTRLIPPEHGHYQRRAD